MNNLLITVQLIFILVVTFSLLFFIVRNIRKGRIKNIPKGFVIIINGGTGVGKTTIARELSNKYNIASIFSTDMIREVVRYDIEKYGSLNDGFILESSYLAHVRRKRNLSESEPDRIINAFKKQCDSLLVPIVKIIFRIRLKRNPMILEGVNVCATKLFNDIPNDPYNRIFFINIYLDSETNHKKRIKKRAQSVNEMKNKTDKYIDNIKSIRMIDEFLKKDTLKAAINFSSEPENIISIENSKSVEKTLFKISKTLEKKIKLIGQ